MDMSSPYRKKTKEIKYKDKWDHLFERTKEFIIIFLKNLCSIIIPSFKCLYSFIVFLIKIILFVSLSLLIFLEGVGSMIRTNQEGILFQIFYKLFTGKQCTNISTHAKEDLRCISALLALGQLVFIARFVVISIISM